MKDARARVKNDQLRRSPRKSGGGTLAANPPPPLHEGEKYRFYSVVGGKNRPIGGLLQVDLGHICAPSISMPKIQTCG
jgi:hypothetical protein